MVTWLVTQFSNEVGYRRFEGPCCLHLQGERKLKFPMNFLEKLYFIEQYILLVHVPPYSLIAEFNM
jgi:hypothetical protein